MIDDYDTSGILSSWGINIRNEKIYFFENIDFTMPDCENGFYIVSAKVKISIAPLYFNNIVRIIFILRCKI